MASTPAPPPPPPPPPPPCSADPTSSARRNASAVASEVFTARNGKRYTLCCVHSASDTAQRDALASKAAALCAAQWPSVGAAARLQAILRSRDSLPCHVVAVDAADEQTVVAHAEVQAGSQQESIGTTAIAYGVVVDASLRGMGVGGAVMRYLERVCTSLRIAYLYLFTSNAVAFYSSLGYHRCCPVASLRENSHRLTDEQVQGLEAMLARKLATQTLPADRPTATDVWMRRRLIFQGVEVDRSDDQLVDMLGTGFRRLDIAAATGFLLAKLPWVKQVGPSCGLTVLAMLERLFLLHAGSPIVSLSRSVTVTAADPLPRLGAFSASSCDPAAVLRSISVGDGDADVSGEEALLQRAIDTGISADGEMFDIDAYPALLSAHYHLASRVEDMSASALLHALQNQCVVLVAYDRDRDNQPCLSFGLRAHWLLLHGYVLTAAASADTDVLDDALVLIGTHSASVRLVVSRYPDLRASNDGLNSFNRDAYPDFIVAEDGPNLRRKMLVIPLTQ